MKRPAGAGREAAVAGRPSGARPVGIGFLEEFAGGVIRLKVGREAIDGDGRALALGPDMASRVGDASGLPIAEMFRNALGEILAAFGPTGSPRSRVLRETAVSAPGRVA